MQPYDDSLWGEISLVEPVVEALAKSQPLQRLKGISQAGASAYLFPWKADVTRFSHSLGVMHVLSSLGASLEEQVAGLLHDVPHTAFSHTIDLVFPSADYNFHERFQQQVVEQSNLPSLLEAHRIPIEAALVPHKYNLLDQPLPALCADRIDYVLRDRHAAGQLSTEEARGFLAHLEPYPSGIVIQDVSAAMWFAGHFVEANRSWTSPGEAGAYWALAQAIKKAMELGLLSIDDLFSTDEAVMSQLRSAGDPLIAAYLQLLQPGTLFRPARLEEPFFTTHMKQRWIDPLVKGANGEEVALLSTLAPKYRSVVSEVRHTRTLIYRLWSDMMPSLIEDLYRDAAIGLGA